MKTAEWSVMFLCPAAVVSGAVVLGGDVAAVVGVGADEAAVGVEVVEGLAAGAVEVGVDYSMRVLLRLLIFALVR